MKDLSEELSKLSVEERKLLAKRVRSRREERPKGLGYEQIAVIGIGCRFPGGVTDTDSYWKLLGQGVDAISEVPKDRWDIDAFYDADPDAAGKMSTRWGGFLEDVFNFDPLFFGISPREILHVDPQQRIFLDASWDALENAFIPPLNLAGTATGVFAGVFSHDFSEIQNRDLRALSVYGGTGGNESCVAGRVSYFLGLQGPALSVNTACSSSLVALHLATQSLRARECDLALAGGVNLILSPALTIIFSKGRMMAPDGRCKTFDAKANGYVRSEGCGVLVLKRLTDAISNGDRIRAIVRGTAVNQDGASSGLSVPNGPAQEAVIRCALSNAQLKPSDITYVEAHGTGTPVGDPLEVFALGSVFKEGRSSANPLIIGSVKTNIGHTEAAAGVAGVIKTILALENKMIPRNLHFENVNPEVLLDRIPATIPIELIPLPKGPSGYLAGVSSFGFSGTNAHVILEAASTRTASSAISYTNGSRNVAPTGIAPHILLLSAKTHESLIGNVNRFEKFLAEHRDEELADICFSALECKSHFSERVSIVASSVPEFRKNLSAFLLGARTPRIVRGNISSDSAGTKVAFLFTGQGSQYPGMAKCLYESQSTFRGVIDRCGTILSQYLEKPLASILFDPREEDLLLNNPVYTQSALCAVEYALFELWTSWGVQPVALMGHSMGEYVAAAAAGMYSLDDAFKLVVNRVRLVEKLCARGEMGAVNADEQTVLEVISEYKDRVSVAVLNGPENTVISGERNAVIDILDRFEKRGLKTKRLAIGWPSHSPLVEPMLDEFERIAAGVQFKPPQITLVSNVTGRSLEPGEVNAAYWRKHIRHPVRFAQGMKFLFDQGCRAFVEMAPGSVLLGMAQMSQPEGIEAGWFPSVKRDTSDRDQLVQSVAGLLAFGVKIDWKKWDPDYQARTKVQLPTYAFQRKRFWIERNGNFDVEARTHSSAADSNLSPTTSEKQPESQITFRDQLSEMEIPKRLQFLNSIIQNLLVQILSLEVGTILDTKKTFISFGMDSLMGIQLRNRIRDLLGTGAGNLLPATLIFKYPTIDSLLDFLVTDIVSLNKLPLKTSYASPSQGHTNGPAKRDGKFGDSLKGLSHSERRDLVHSKIREFLVQILSLDPETVVDSKKPFTAFGMDSLMGMEFRNRIRDLLGADFGKALPITLIFKYPTVDTLLNFLMADEPHKN